MNGEIYDIIINYRRSGASTCRNYFITIYWRNNKMKLFNWIFAKPKKQETVQPSYVFKSWEASAKDYNKTHNIRNRLI